MGKKKNILKEYEKRVREYLMGRPKENIITLYLQAKWERDIAISQLQGLGYQLGEKTRKPQLTDEEYATCLYYLTESERRDGYAEGGDHSGEYKVLKQCLESCRVPKTY